MHCSDISNHRRKSASSRCAFRFPLDEGSLSGRGRQVGCLGASEEFDRSWRNSIEAASGIDIRRMYLTRSGFSPELGSRSISRIATPSAPTRTLRLPRIGPVVTLSSVLAGESAMSVSPCRTESGRPALPPYAGVSRIRFGGSGLQPNLNRSGAVPRGSSDPRPTAPP